MILSSVEFFFELNRKWKILSLLITLNPLSPGIQLVPHQLEKVRNMILSLLELRNLIEVLQEEPVSPNSFTLKSQLSYSYTEGALSVSVINKTFE